MKRKSTKLTAFVLSFLMALSSFFALPMFTANAAGERVTIELIDYSRGGVNWGPTGWGHYAVKFMNGWSISEARQFSAKAIADNDMHVAYCVQPGVELHNYDKTSQILPDTFFDTYSNGSCSNLEIQYLIGRIFQYGYTGKVTFTLTDDQIGEIIATQVLVWETIVGERGPSFNKITPSSGLNACLDTVSATHPIRSTIMGHYNRIANAVISHSTIPSFLKRQASIAETEELTWNGSAYTASLTDTNGVLSNFNFTSTTQGVSFSKNGNTLTISTSTPPTGNINIQAERTGSKRSAVVFWADGKIINKGQVQGLTTVGQDITDPIAGFVNVKVSYGKLSVNKVSDKGESLGGVTFGVFTNPACTTYAKDPSGNDVKLVTNSSGNATSPDLQPNTVYVKEIDMMNDQHLVLNMNPTVYQVQVMPGVTTPINAQNGTVTNRYKTVTIQIAKENIRPDMMTYDLAGAVFEIRNLTTGQKWSVTTTSSGFSEKKDIPLGVIEIEELSAPYGFEVNSTVQTYDLRKGEKGVDIILQQCIFPEYPQTATVKITKYDAETNTRAQGDTQLTGAVFSIRPKVDVKYLDGTVKYKKDQVIQTLDCGPGSTSATSMELPVGFDYYIVEEKPPVGMNPLGYNIDFTLDYRGQEVKTYLYDASVKNTVIKGQIEMYKIMEGDAGNETTLNGENGAKFQVWLKSAGSYNAALPTERDFLTTSNNPTNDLAGWAKTKLLPYGVYVVHQLTPENNTEPIPDFEVFIDTNLKVYPYYKWNGPVVAFVQMAKLDAETKQVIPLPNTAFRLWDYQTNDWYSVRTTYPSIMYHDIFYTDSSGTLTLPEPLRPGRFRWVETGAPFGYVNPIAVDPNYKGIDFVVDQNMQVVDGSYMIKDNIPIFLFTHEDMPQKARLGVDKYGDQFSDVTMISSKEEGTIKMPVFTRQRLAGCQFIIRAKDDIFTPDGTKRYSAGQTVDTLISSATETVYSKMLYLGTYEILEVSSVSGFVKDDSPREVTLVYRGEMIVSFDAMETFDNERGQVQLELEKLMEKLPGSDERPFYAVKFGLFAAQDFQDYLGNTLIHKGDLMEIISLDSAGKYSSQKAMLWGKYTISEIQTSPLYQIDPTVHPIEIQPDNPTQKVTTININNGEPLVNELNRAKVKVIKTDGDTKTPLHGVTFEIIDADGNIVEIITGPDGTAETDWLPVSDKPYIVREKSTLTEYVLDDEPLEIILTEHEKVYELELQNVKIKGNLKLIKSDSANGARIADTVFELYAPDGSLYGTYTTSDNGEIFVENVEYGVGYRWIEKTPAPGYRKNDKEYIVSVKENGSTEEIEVTNDKIPDKPDNPDVPKTGDTSNVALWLGLMAASVISLAGLIFLKKRKTKKAK